MDGGGEQNSWPQTDAAVQEELRQMGALITSVQSRFDAAGQNCHKYFSYLVGTDTQRRATQRVLLGPLRFLSFSLDEKKSRSTDNIINWYKIESVGGCVADATLRHPRSPELFAAAACTCSNSRVKILNHPERGMLLFTKCEGNKIVGNFQTNGSSL